MLKSVEKRGMVESIKCSGHVKSSQNCDFTRVNSFHDVICEFEQSGLSRMEFAIGGLQRAETGRYRYMRKKTSKGKTFEDFANSVQIRNEPKICKLGFW